MISLRTHNVIDFFLGGWLIVSPWIFGFSDVTHARELFMWGGLALLTYSLITDYEFSAVKILPVGLHMTLDTVLGLALMLLPSLVGYRDLLTDGQYAAHLAMGALTIGFVALTLPAHARLGHGMTRSSEHVPAHG